MSRTGFVSVPVVPVFAGMSKEFAERLEKPAKQSGERAGKAMSAPLEGAVTNLERQVKASSGKLDQLDRAHEKSISKREQQQDKLEASTLRLEDAENKYKAAIEAGDSGLRELARVKDEKARVAKATDDLRQAEVDVTVAEKKHEDQLKDLHETTAKYEMAQADLAASVDESSESLDGLGDRFAGLKDNMMQGLNKITTGAFLGIGAKIGTSIMSGVQDVMSKGWETALDIDQVSRSLSAMTSETEVAEQMMTDLRDVAGEMPVDYTAFLNAANTLAYMGYEGDEAIKVLENVATAATGAGNDGTEALEAAAGALGKMQANGKVTQDEISTISSQGVPMLDMLIEHFGMAEGSYEELKDKISEGGVELDDVFAALGDTGSGTFQMLADSAENMNQSLDAQMKMLKDDIFVGVGEALQPILNEMDFEGIADSVGNIAARLMGFLPLLVDLGLWVANNIHWLAPAAGVLAGIAVSIKLVNLAMAANPLVLKAAAIAAGITAVIAAFTWFFTQTEVGRKIWEKFTDALVAGWDWVMDKLAPGIEWIQEKFELVKGAWSDLVSAFTSDEAVEGDGPLGRLIGVDRANAILGTLQTVKGAWGELTSAFTSDEAVEGNALGHLIGVNAANNVLGFIQTAREAWEGFTALLFEGDYTGAFRNAFGIEEDDPIIDRILTWREMFMELPDFFSGIADILFKGDYTGLPFGMEEDGVVAGIFFGIRDAVIGTWESFKNLWDILVEVGKVLADSVWSTVQTVFSTLWTVVQSLWSIFKSLAEVVWGFAQMIGPVLLPILKVVGAVIGGVVVGAVMGLIGAIRFAAEIIEFFAGVIQWLVENVLSPLIGFLGEVAGFLIENLAGAISWVVEKFSEMASFLLENFWPAVQSVMEWVGDAFSAVWDGLSWAYENIIKPVFDAIWWTAQVTLAVIGTAILGPLLVAWNLLSAGIQWGWENYIKPTWEFLQAAAVFMWENVLQPVFGWIQDGWQRLADGIMWAWENIIRPAWDAVSSAATWMWESVLQPTFGFITNAWQAVGDGIRWVYDHIIKPAWDALAAALQWLWDNVIMVYFNLVISSWQAVGDAIRWVYDNVIKTTWDALGNALTWMYDNIIRPTLQWISDRWTDMAEMLEFGWHWIRDNVFDPLGSGLETVQGWFQTAVDAIKDIWYGLREAAAEPVRFVVDTVWNNGLLKAIEAVTKFLPGLDAPDPVRIGFARGGILPGFSRMRDGDDQLVPMRRGEGVLVSEGLQDEQSRQLFLSANEAAKGGQSFAAFMSDYVAGYAGGGIIGSMQSVMREFYPELSLTSGLRPGDSGYHGTGQAADFSNTGSGMPSTPAMQAAAAFMFGNYGDQLEQLIHHPARNIGSGMDVGDGFGYYGAGTMYGHTDHIHLAALQPLVDPSGVVQMMPYDGEGGGGFSLLGVVKAAWDAVVSAINPFDGEGNGSWFSEMPGAFLSGAAEKLWEFVTGKVGSGSYDGSGGISGNVESWREMAMAAMRRNGFDADDPAQVDAMLRQIQSESSGDPSAVQGVIDVNSGGNEAVGLLQVIPGTFAAHRDPSLPNDRTDPWANMNASLRYYRATYGDDLTTTWGHGHGYAEGGIVDLSNMLVRDFGGLVPHGAAAINMSGRDEMMLPPETTALLNQFFAEFPEVAQALVDATTNLENAAHWLEQAASPHTEEGVTARQSARRFLDLGLDIPGAEIITAVLNGEEALWESRARGIGHLDNLAEKEAALEDARRALAELAGQEISVSEDEQKKLDDAKAAVEEAKADQAKADSDEARAEAADKLADAEANLTSVREDLEASTAQSAEQHATDLTQANEDVAAAEQDLIAARQAQVKDLDHIVLVSQSSITGLIPQAEALASQIIGMGAPANLVAQGLGAVTGGLANIAGLVGPAGITLGMVFDAAKIIISLIKTIVSFVRNLINRIREAHLAAVQAMADGWQVIADYAALVVELQGNVSSLQQEIVRGLNEQRVAEFQLRVAQQDRLIAEAESSLAVAEARLALDREIERGNIAAQLRLMGLHEDWDSYLSYQALVAGGVLDEWSDAAISALFTYEATRAQALRAELSARVDQINAEAHLAAITRQNTRNQQDLLKAQERLIRMSADVAGVDLVDATATSQVAKIIAEMAEIQQKMDSSLLGRLGVGAWGVEHRGRQAELDSYRQVLHSIAEETGVAVSDAQINQAISQMKRVGWTDGDPMAVLRGIMPELVEAETALRMQEYMGPIWDAQDQRDQLERDIEDFESEIDLFDRTQPLEETLAGLDYTIASLEQAAQAWADGNEGLRGDYLAAARAQWEAARALGVDWQLDDGYATPGVRDQITKEVTIHMDGSQVYTADQVDALLAEVTSGSNVRVTTKKSSTTVANARREGGV